MKKCYNPGPWLCYVLIVYSVCLQNVMDHKALPQECCESTVNVLAILDQSKGEDQEKKHARVRISRTNMGRSN